jgi:hypothetical protein
MLARRIVPTFARVGFLALVFTWFCSFAQAQTENNSFPQGPPPEMQTSTPLTNQEFVSMLYELPKHPGKRDAIVTEIRRRGIGFPLTDGLRSLLATKSGNDPLLRHTLEEAERRRVNPKTEAPPPENISAELLEKTRQATLAAADKMPDFLVKQQISRSHAYGHTNNWSIYDRLTVAVSYRASAGEQYKLLSINGMPQSEDEREGSTYGTKLGGTISTGEYVTVLSDLFKPAARAEFKVVDTDLIRGRPTVVYEYSVKKEFSHYVLGWGEHSRTELETIAGYRGRIWVDRENNRVLRMETIATEIDPGFPITAAQDTIDYDWVTINEQPYLLPSRAIVELTARMRGQTEQTRNDILFRGYRKFGAEVKIIDIEEKDFPPDKPEENEPGTPPVPKKPDKP